MSAHTLPPVSYNPDEDWLRPILCALLVHLLVVLIFGLAWWWSPTRNTSAAAGEGTLEASLELSGAEMAAAQQALSQSIAQSGTYLQPASPTRQVLAPPAVEPVQVPEAVLPVMVPDTHEQLRVLAEQQRQQQEEAERQHQAELAAEQQRQQQEEAERQRQAELAAEQQRQQQEEAERQRQAELAAEQQRQEQAQQEVERQQKLAQAAELRQRREQLEQQAAAEQQRLAQMQSEQRRAQQAAASTGNTGGGSSSSASHNTGVGNGGVAGAGGESNELLARYNAAIQQAVLRQWIRPDSVQLGQRCRLTIHQIPGGQVISVQFSSDCSYDQAGRDSVERAILRASPLPYRGFENVAERILNFNFEAQNR